MKRTLILGFILSAAVGFAAETVNVACIGDSLTQGSGAPEDKTYPAQLQAALGDGYEVKNFGTGWATALTQGVTDERGSRNVAYVKSKAYEQSLNYSANVAIVMLGMNDSKPVNWEKHAQEFEQNLTSIIEGYKKTYVNPTILLATTPWVARDNFEVSGKNVEEQIVPIQRKVAEKTGCTLVDVYAATKDKADLYAEDGIHLNEKGYETIAKLFADAIRAQSGKK